MQKKVLVTGGTGYIGSHTVVELINAGYEVIIIDNLYNSKIEVLEGIEKITGVKPDFHNFDLTEKDKVNSFFRTNSDIAAVIHFAAYKAVGESVEKPLKYYYNNISSLLNVLNACNEFSINNFVFSSSCTVYGEPDNLPISETFPVKKAMSPYGNTKQIAEEILNDFGKSKTEFNSILLRYFNPIGAHDSALIGELPFGVPDNLVPYVTQTAAGIRDILYINGNDYDTPDGTCIRDYIHVVDLAKAHVISVKRLLAHKNKTNVEVFNLGTGKGLSVLDIVKTFEKVNNIKLNYKIRERRQGDVTKLWADTKYANEELGWKAEKNMEEMLKSAWNWEKKYRNI